MAIDEIIENSFAYFLKIVKETIEENKGNNSNSNTLRLFR